MRIHCCGVVERGEKEWSRWMRLAKRNNSIISLVPVCILLVVLWDRVITVAVDLNKFENDHVLKV